MSHVLSNAGDETSLTHSGYSSITKNYSLTSTLIRVSQICTLNYLHVDDHMEQEFNG